MKNLPLLFCGIFFTLAFSWVGIILSSHLQFGSLGPTSSQLIRPDTGDAIAGLTYVDPQGRPQPGQTNPAEPQFPLALPGNALRGKGVYIAEGCIYCHTQQVRRRGFGADFERNWGARQSVPRDYIRQERVLLGTMRTGPDLMTVGQRIPDPGWHHLHLYDPQITSEGSIMPPYAYLYEMRPIPETGPSPEALRLSGTYAPPGGYEVVPRPQARDLVAYLLSLRMDYDLPEAKLQE